MPRVYGARVVVLAGSGDNGGDALYAAARLARRGAHVVAVEAGTRLHAGGAAALRAAGGVLNAVDAVVTGKARNAFCAVRPPGHHATPSRGMGFCLLNNIAIV